MEARQVIPSKRIEQGTRGAVAALALAGLLSASAAFAGTPSSQPLDGMSGEVCGKWVLKLRNFGKQKITDYGWVPQNFRGAPLNPSFDEALLDVRMDFFFGLFGPGTWFAVVPFPSQIGEEQSVIISGTYTVRGRRVDMDLLDISDVPDPMDPLSPDTNDAGVDQVELLFRNFAENQLFRRRELVTEYPYAEVLNRRLRINGRFKMQPGAAPSDPPILNLKIKMKARMNYDVQFDLNSTQPDQFDSRGTLNLRASLETCRVFD